jgi:ABC-type uncharacterized transport system involved in gliding motility auxiliary subunit
MDTKTTSSRFWKLGGSLAGLTTLLVILVAANVILGQFRLRKDFTAERLYTLSDGSRQVLSKLDRDVTLMFFFNSSAPEVPGPLKHFARQVEDLLKEYELAGGGKVQLEKYDPKPDSDAEDLAQRYGLQGQMLPPAGPTLYLGLVAVSGDRQAAIPLVDPRTEELLEYNITRMLHRVTTLKKPVVGVLSSLPVMGSQPPPFMMPGQRRPQSQPPWACFQDLAQDYDVRRIAPTAKGLDADLDTLIVVHPKNLPETMLYALDQFVLRGGRLVAFVDPLCVVDPGEDPSSPFGMGGMGGGRSSTLGKLFDAWGVKYEQDKIVADLQAITPLRGRNNAIEQSPLYLSLRKTNLSAHDALTASAESLMMVMSGAFANEAAEGLKVTPLITTSEQSALTDAMMAQFDPNAFRRQFKSGHKRMNLAMRLQGTFKTAFPAGEPADPADTNAVAKAAAEPLKESAAEGNVLLVADADMLYNEFCGQDVNLFGYRAFQPFNDNVNFFAGGVEQMSGSADLIGIRCRGTANRPFTRVLALQAEAQEKWLEQEQILEEKLQASQRRIDELQQQKDEKQRFILSPEQARELEGVRADGLKYKQDLKLVRRNLREDIEALGMKLKVVNILLMPLVVAVAGIAFAALRRSRQ